MEFSSDILKFLPQRNKLGFVFLVLGFCSLGFGLFFGFYLVFFLGLKCLQINWVFCHIGGKKNGDLANGLSSKCRLVEACDQKSPSSKCQYPKVDLSDDKVNNVEECDDDNEKEEEDDDTDEGEDGELDAMALRKMVKIERGRARKVRRELEKERLAESWAAEEAMAMILRLQSEKSFIEMEANQYRRMAEQKLEYSEGIIQSLEWIVAKQVEERSILEDQLSLLRKKLEIFMKESEKDELEEVHMNSTLEDYCPLDDMGSVICSLDLDR